MGLGELPPLGITHFPLWLLWGRGNPSHSTTGEQVPLAASEQPQAMPAPKGAPWSGHHSHLCDHLSAKALPGPIPSPRGCPGLVDGAELGLHLGTCCAPVLQLPGAVDVCQQQVMHRAATPQEVPRATQPWPHRSWKSPHTLLWCWVNSQPRAHSAPCGSRMPVTLSSYSHRAQAVLGNHWRTSGGSAGMRQGLLSWRGKEQRGEQTPAPQPDHGADCPQPHIHTLSRHRPHSEMTWEGPLGEPHYPDPHRKGWGDRRALGVCSCSRLPHAPPGLNTCYSRQGKPLPRSIPQIHRKTDSLTGMQRTSGQAGHTISVTG